MSGCAPPFVKNSLNRKTMMFKSMKSMNESRVSTESLPCLFEDQLAELLVTVRQDRPRHDQTGQNLKQLRTKHNNLNFPEQPIWISDYSQHQKYKWQITVKRQQIGL